MHRRVGSGRCLGRSIVWLTLTLCMFSVGCAKNAPIRMDVRNDLVLPERPVVIFFADGVRATVLDEMLTAGELPNLKRYLYDRGCRVDNAVTCMPSITYAATASIVTGRFPGHHNITGNKWFDRTTCIFQNYTFAHSYREIDHQLQAPTLYEYLNDRFTVTIQTPCRRGATRNIDNWMMSGACWAMRWRETLDQIVATQFDLVAAEANKTGHWPDLVMAYFPATDEIGHRIGSDTQAYRHSLKNLDTQVGRICAALGKRQLLERTTLVFISDHGHDPAADDNNFEPADFLRKELNLPVVDKVFLEHAWPPDRVKWLNEHSRIVVVNGGARRAQIHLNANATWQDAPTFADTMSFVQKFSKNEATKNSSQTLIDMLIAQKPVDAAMARIDANRSLIVTKSGRAVVERRIASDGRKEYRYLIETGDPLGYKAIPRAAALITSGFADAQSWLDATAEATYPDIVPQTVELFDSPRAGQIIIFAADGWDFSRRDLGGHGSIFRQDMIVPMVFAGPDIAPGQLHAARIVDVMPTILDVMGVGDRANQFGTLDGHTLLPRMRRATTQPTSQPVAK